MRKSGFYWVRGGTTWDIAYYSEAGSCWFLAGMAHFVKDENFAEIDERPIIRLEK